MNSVNMQIKFIRDNLYRERIITKTDNYLLVIYKPFNFMSNLLARIFRVNLEVYLLFVICFTYDCYSRMCTEIINIQNTNLISKAIINRKNNFI